MSVATQAVSIGQHLPWVNMTLDYTEQLVEKIPDELLDFRPVDPNGHYMFSLAEIAMHLADTRRMFAHTLSGDASEEGFWTEWDENDSGNEMAMQWKFKPRGTKQEILDSLRSGREELNAWLSLPVSSLNESTDGTRESFNKNLEKMREKGADTSEVELRGPSTVNRVLFAVTAHESGHRGSLQTLLRLQGVDARGEH
jgi:uncharacterized damage-inducible protein DinB